MNITFVTGNAGKLREARAALEPLGHTVAQDAGGYPEIQADTLAEVAAAGIEACRRRIDGPFILEDAGLFVDALDGFPGVYSSYALRTIGNEGVLRLLEGRPRTARFEAVLAHWDGAAAHLHHGVCTGRIADAPRGDEGFGFDPIFIPDGEDRTFAQMTPTEKTPVSHRGRALAAFVATLSPAR